MDCSICGAQILDDWAHSIDGKPACEDCYYEALGAEIEEHPIGRASAHGCSGDCDC